MGINYSRNRHYSFLLSWLTISAFFLLMFLPVATCLSEKNSFTITRFTGTYSVDGSLDEPFWSNTEPLTGFRIDADPDRVSSAETTVYLAYDNEVLLAVFVCDEPDMARLLSALVSSKKRDAEAGNNEYCELQVFSRPATPYYSPFLQRLDYKNANNKVRTQRHYIVTASDKGIEGNIYKVGAHTKYITDDTWTGSWEHAVSRDKDRYVVEMAIPWSEIGGLPGEGHDFKLHFVRRRSVSVAEIVSFNWYSGNNIDVYSFDPASFDQEHPTIFSPVVFAQDHAVLTRFIETSDPWAVNRTDTEYKRLLTDRKISERATHFYLGLRGFLLPDSIRTRYDDISWAAEENNFFTEVGRAGMNGPFLPGFMRRVGESGLDSLYQRYGMQFTYHTYGNTKAAQEAGATIIRPRGTPAFFDPKYVEIKNRTLEEWLSKYGKQPWLFDIRGQDEPFNQIATVLQPGTYEMVNRDLKEEFGVELGLPVGTPNIPYQDQEVHERSRRVPDHETALRRIALFRWLNRKFAEVARSEYEIVRRLAPGKLYQAYNRNAVADMDFLDQSLIYDITDYYSADPYPSFDIYVYGAARCRYHVGFTSKLVTDMAAGKPTQMIIQGCDMIQRYSTPVNVREWASQAAKTGAVMLDWWGTPRLDHPDLYREMLRLSRLWKDLPALDIPATSDIAVLYSDDSRIAAGDEALHAHYTLHTILGEKLGAWYSFVSENHVRKGLHSLDSAKLIIAPQLGYISREFAQTVMKCVKDGASLVVLDPDALTHDIESGALTGLRAEFLGLSVCPKRGADKISPTESGRSRFALNGPLPLRPMHTVGYAENARILYVPYGANVLFTYADGKPAGYSRRYGDGEMIVLGAMPFYDSVYAIETTEWERFFAAEIDRLGIERDQPIWKFMFPETGGEVDVFELLK
ncbi:hypothetical protein ACFL47_06735 [Candidatus Latescibacterota bacterium]